MAIEKLSAQRCNRFINDCKKQKKTKILNDGGGLYIRATAGGTASWIFRFEKAGKTREMGLGSLDTYGLDEARERARKCRQMLDEGRDPIAERGTERAAQATARQPVAKPFRWCAEQFILSREAGWTNPKFAKDWRNSLARYAFPVIGDMAMSAITTEHVLQVLQPQWLERTETLLRVRNRIEQIWDWGKAMHFCGGSNPARWRGHLDKLLDRKARKETEHLAAVPFQAVPALVLALQQSGPAGPGAAADALQFAIHSALRYDAFSGIEWDEIDLVERVLTVPASRMKGRKGKRRPFRVPLTPPMLAILERRRALRLGDFVFTTDLHDQPISGHTLRAELQKHYPGVTVHGFRASFSTWCSETTAVPVELRGACLAHATGNAVADAYFRGDLFARRRELLEKWSRFCTTPLGGNVMPLQRAVS
jgi:integrase